MRRQASTRGYWFRLQVRRTARKNFAARSKNRCRARRCGSIYEFIRMLLQMLKFRGSRPRLLPLAAPLLIIAVLMTQRALQRIAAAETAARDSEERLRLVADSVPALISYVDRDER